MTKDDRFQKGRQYGKKEKGNWVLLKKKKRKRNWGSEADTSADCSKGQETEEFIRIKLKLVWREESSLLFWNDTEQLCFH